MSSRLPNLIIGGVHNAGTTSLFVYLSKHPEVEASDIKEIGFIMSLRDGESLPPIEKYKSYFSHCKDERYVMEAMLGENVDMYTFIQKSFEGINDHSKQDYFTRGVREGFCCDYLPAWMEKYVNDLKIVFFDDLKTSPMELTKEICERLGVSTDVFIASNFTVENKTVNYKNKSVHKLILAVNRKLESLRRRNHGLKKILKSFYCVFNANKSSGETIDARTLKLLNELYSPYNVQLLKMLQQHGYKNLPAWLVEAEKKNADLLTIAQH